MSRLQSNIAKLGIFFIVVALALFCNLSYLQVFGQKKLVENPANTRRLLEEYSIARGKIITADGAVAAESVEAEGVFRYRRQYPLGATLSHIIGYDSPQFGRSGLEQQYNEYLLGVKPPRGWLEEITREGEAGYDLYLTIDSRVQAAAARGLGARKGAVVAMDPRTGAVLAAYSWPAFDPNALVGVSGSQAAEAAMQSYSGDSSSPLLNRVTSGLYPPGSSFKVVTASAGLESGLPATTAYNCLGEWPVGGSRVTNYGSPPRDFGIQDMESALTQSVNTYFAQLAVAMGSGSLVRYARNFGLNSTPPLDYPSVSASHIPSAGDMDEVELAWTGAGQGRLLVTPLQLCMIGCGIANGGKIMVPHLMKEIRSEGDILDRFSSEEWRSAISPQTAKEVLEMMVSVVEEGTGKGAAIPGISVAGKTGTAEVEGQEPHAWFLGIAPAENPRVAVAVIVENGGGGGQEAAPIARQVIEAALK